MQDETTSGPKMGPKPASSMPVNTAMYAANLNALVFSAYRREIASGGGALTPKRATQNGQDCNTAGGISSTMLRPDISAGPHQTVLSAVPKLPD